MCKFNPKNNGRRIDPCMKNFIKLLNFYTSEHGIKIVACCCGHGKYPMTIIIKGKPYQEFRFVFNRDKEIVQDLVSGIIILRKKRFYKKDKQGYYYIPEVSNVK